MGTMLLSQLPVESSEAAIPPGTFHVAPTFDGTT